ncbi:MAG TPA: NUDIX hydrolase, partial [Acidimicrobiales bacterium]|nr:NUDIX hydrolase [Acidimicrobiales bacterium]
EDIAVCARREVVEEIGLDIDLVSEPAVVVDGPPQRVDVVFRARAAAGVDPATASPRSAEIREVRWFAPDELPTLQHEAVTALLALARSAAPGRRRGAAADDSDDPGDRALLRAAAAAAEQR